MSKSSQTSYKQILRIRKNIQNQYKFLAFKRKKWKSFQSHSRKQLKFFKRFKIKDQGTMTVSKFKSKGNSLRKKFKHLVLTKSIIRQFYGNITRRYLRNIVSKIAKTECAFSSFFQRMESRLDVVLYRAKFAYSIQNAKQLIIHHYIKVNNILISKSSYQLKSLDVVSVCCTYGKVELIKKNVGLSNFWPSPPKHLIINYKTLQLLFYSDSEITISPQFNHYLDLNHILCNVRKV